MEENIVARAHKEMERLQSQIHKYSVAGVFECVKVADLHTRLNQIRRALISGGDFHGYLNRTFKHGDIDVFSEEHVALVKECMLAGDTVQECCYKLAKRFRPRDAEVSP